MATTCIITLSRQPHQRNDVPSGFSYINQAQVVRTHRELHEARRIAINKCQDDYLMFVDDDDPMPTGVWRSDFKGFCTGPEFVNGKEYVIKDREVTLSKLQHRAIHKGIIRTIDAQRVMGELPDGDYVTEYMLHNLVVLWKGLVYEPQFKIYWNPGEMHYRTANAFRNASFFMFQSARGTLNKLKMKYGDTD